MEIAFTAQNDLDTAHDVVCIVESSGAPRKGDTVEIDDFVYEVESVEWHIDTRDSEEADYPLGNLHGVIVRLRKLGEA